MLIWKNLSLILILLVLTGCAPPDWQSYGNKYKMMDVILDKHDNIGLVIGIEEISNFKHRYEVLFDMDGLHTKKYLNDSQIDKKIGKIELEQLKRLTNRFKSTYYDVPPFENCQCDCDDCTCIPTA